MSAKSAWQTYRLVDLAVKLLRDGKFKKPTSVGFLLTVSIINIYCVEVHMLWCRHERQNITNNQKQAQAFCNHNKKIA